MINKILGDTVGSVSLGEGERGEKRSKKGGREGRRDREWKVIAHKNITSQWYKRLYNLAK